MNSLSRVLVATDTTHQAQTVLTKAVHVANMSQAELTVLSVELPKAPPLIDKLKQLLSASDQATLEPAEPHYPSKHLALELKQCAAASLACAIVNELNHQDYDLLIVEHHQYPALRLAFGHSDDWRLLQQVPLPVLFVSKLPWEKQGSVLTALEIENQSLPHREFNRQLVDASALLASIFNMELHLVSCYQSKDDLSVAFKDAQPQSHQLVKTLWHRLQQHAERLSLADSRLHLASGMPDDMVPQVASQWHTNLVVMGTQEYSHVMETFIGHVSEQLLNQLPCDVLALKPRKKPRPH